jgi:putative endonuclease
MKGGWVYIMTNHANGVLYVGVTADLSRRAFERREGPIKGFTKRYGLKRLVYFERYDDIRDAIQRESNLKHWPRAWKIRLVLDTNPEWARSLRRPRLIHRCFGPAWMAGTSPAMTARVTSAIGRQPLPTQSPQADVRLASSCRPPTLACLAYAPSLWILCAPFASETIFVSM